jgi:hypothetical protein
MLVTDSLSPTIKNEEIGVSIENTMRVGLFVLFVNRRFYALFDRYENMTKPIPVYDKYV